MSKILEVIPIINIVLMALSMLLFIVVIGVVILPAFEKWIKGLFKKEGTQL